MLGLQRLHCLGMRIVIFAEQVLHLVDRSILPGAAFFSPMPVDGGIAHDREQPAFHASALGTK